MDGGLDKDVLAQHRIEQASRDGKEFLEVTLWGDVSYEMVVALFTDLNARARQDAQLRILIDETRLKPALMGYSEIRKVVEFWRTMPGLRIARIAVVAPNLVLYGLNRMFALIANEEGFNVFIARGDATAWLLMEPD
jgi:hypothetical protein